MKTMSTKLFLFSAIIGAITFLSVLDASAKQRKSKSDMPTPISDEQFLDSVMSEVDNNDAIQRRYRKLDDQAGIQFLNISITRCGHLSDTEYKACQEQVLDGLEAGKSPATIIPNLEKKIDQHTLLQPTKKVKAQRKIASHVKHKSKKDKKISNKGSKGKKISKKKSKSKSVIAYNR